jgi:colanic acid/amylovoran biosynthesis glycosyltransferase
MRKNVAIVSPNQNAYSETFIQAHKAIDAHVFFYYGGGVPNYLEGEGRIKLNLSRKLINLLIRKLRLYKKGKQCRYTYAALFQSFKHNKIEIVLAEYGTTGAKILAFCKAINMPIVTIFHGYDASRIKILEQNKEDYLNLFEYSQKIIAVSAQIRSTLIGLGCPSDKIIHTPCAPHDDFFRIEPTFAEPQSFVAIGRFTDKKAPYYTILAFKKVLETYPDAKLYFAGTGELWNTCLNLITFYKLDKNVSLLGAIPPAVYVKLLNKVGGFVQHSITAEDGDMEGTPVAILEAIAAGIPVIATKHAGITDVVMDGITGFLVNEHDVDDMASKMCGVIADPLKARKMAAKGRKFAYDNFRMEKHLEFITQALA